MIFSRCRTFRHCSSEKAKRRISAIVKPWKLFFLISSYRFMLKHRNSQDQFGQVHAALQLPSKRASTCSGCNITTLKVSSSCSYCNTTTPTLNFRLKQHNHHCLLVKVHDASPQLSHLQVHGITTTTVTGKCCNTTTLKSARTRLCNTLSFTVNQHRLIMQHHNHDC